MATIERAQKNDQKTEFYNSYRSLIYQIALQCTSDELLAEAIVERAFFEFFKQVCELNKPRYLGIALIKLTLKISKEQFNCHLTDGFLLTQFEKFPIINGLMSRNISLREYCGQNKLLVKDAMKKLKEEIKTIKSLNSVG